MSNLYIYQLLFAFMVIIGFDEIIHHDKNKISLADNKRNFIGYFLNTASAILFYTIYENMTSGIMTVLFYGLALFAICLSFNYLHKPGMHIKDEDIMPLLPVHYACIVMASSVIVM